MNKHIKHSLRFSIDQDAAIEQYCRKHNIESRAAFFRYAIAQVLKPDIEDPELVFSSLSQLHDTLHTVERQQEILFSFIGFFARYFLAYHPEIPGNLKDAAGTSALERYERAFKSFQESLKSSPAMFESLLADYFENT